MGAKLIACRKRRGHTLPDRPPGGELLRVQPTRDDAEPAYDEVEAWSFPSIDEARRAAELAEAGPEVLLLAAETHVVKADRSPTGVGRSLFFCRRMPGLSQVDFERHWLGPHARLAATLGIVARYEQHVVRIGYPALYDGVAEVWFTSPEAMRSGRRTPEFEAVQADEVNFLDQDSKLLLIIREAPDVP